VIKAYGISRGECERVIQKLLVSVRMWKARCGSRIGWLFQRMKLGKRRLFMEVLYSSGQ
jgi:hypothetical protein